MSEQNVQPQAETTAELNEQELETAAGGILDGIVGDIVNAVEEAYLGIKQGIMCDK